VTIVFFLFLLHASLGLMAVLPVVPDRAGAKFFKFCAASSAFMTTAGLWLLWRRGGGSAALLWSTGAFLALTVLYNRARHFDWRRALAPLLWAALVAGVVASLAADRAGPRAILAATDLTSALLLGAAAGAMILGHWYLVVLDLPIAALRRLTLLLVVALALRTIVVALVLAGPAHAGLDQARAVAAGLWSPDGVFVWMRLLFGIAGPLSLVWFIWKTVEIRSTQSATGILYVQLFLVMAGELLAKYLRATAGIPL
jgi:protein NrfD